MRPEILETRVSFFCQRSFQRKFGLTCIYIVVISTSRFSVKRNFLHSRLLGLCSHRVQSCAADYQDAQAFLSASLQTQAEVARLWLHFDCVEVEEETLIALGMYMSTYIYLFCTA